MDWETASEFCNSTGGHLFSLTNQEFVSVIDFINQKKLESGFWLGATFQNSSWIWSDGTSITDSDIFWTLT